MNVAANHKPPLMIEQRTGKWVTYGATDNYPDYLIDMFNRSAKHGAIITGKVNMICGGGLVTDNPQVKEMMNKVSQEESWQDLAIKVVTDFELFNGIPLEIIWNKLGTGFASIRHLPFNKIRKSVTGRKLLYSEQFGSQLHRFNPQGIVHYKPFDEQDRKGKQLLYFRLYRPNTQVYPLPDYMGALAAIETDVEIDNFHLNEVKNGFWGGKLVNFNNGQPDTDEEMKSISDQLQWKTGTDQANRFVLTFSDGADKAPTISDLSSGDLDKKFVQLRQDVNQTIFTGHKVTSPMLFGIKESGQLGGRSELIEADELFKSTYIAARRKIVLSVINELIFIQTGVKDACYFAEHKPFKPQFSDEIISQNLTQNEIRATADYKPLDGGDVLIPPANNNTTNTPQGQPTAAPTMAAVNDNIKNLTAKQHQQLLRIIRQFGKGQLTKEAATTLLKTGLGLTDEDIFSLLSIDETPEQIQEAHFELQESQIIAGLRKYGQDKSKFQILASQKFNFADFKEGKESEASVLAKFVSDNTAAKIINVYKHDSNATKESIAKMLGIDVAQINDVVAELIKKKQLKVAPDESITVTSIGLDVVNNSTLKAEIFIMYDYDLSPNVGGDKIIAGTREFCREVINLNKMWSLADIQTLGVELGYDVWERRGGFWRHKDGEITPYCRHSWVQRIVTKIID